MDFDIQGRIEWLEGRKERDQVNLGRITKVFYVRNVFKRIIFGLKWVLDWKTQRSNRKTTQRWVSKSIKN